jgi:hypothetical protein
VSTEFSIDFFDHIFFLPSVNNKKNYKYLVGWTEVYASFVVGVGKHVGCGSPEPAPGAVSFIGAAILKQDFPGEAHRCFQSRIPPAFWSAASRLQRCLADWVFSKWHKTGLYPVGLPFHVLVHDRSTFVFDDWSDRKDLSKMGLAGHPQHCHCCT